MLLNVLKVFENYCELVLDDEVFTGNDNGNGKVLDVLHAVVSGKNALPNA